MDIKDIKFRKERVSEFTVRHWFDAGTKYLGPVYAVKHYNYNVYDAEGNLLTRGKYLHIPTLKAVKEWIAGYDAAHEAQLEEERKEREAYEAELKARYEAEQKALLEFTAPVEGDAHHMVGSEFVIRMPRLNKQCHIGEYVAQLTNPEDYQDNRAKVIGHLDLTNEQWDHMVTNLMENRDDWVKGEESDTAGGNASDAPELQGHDDFFKMINDPELKALWFATQYEMVHAVTAPNRRTFYVNTQGYRYARYVGFAV